MGTFTSKDSTVESIRVRVTGRICLSPRSLFQVTAVLLNKWFFVLFFQVVCKFESVSK